MRPLAERLKRGALPVDDALALFGRIAEALEAAHEKSIVHRDLKRANIKIPPGGQVEVLDVGLAVLEISSCLPSSASARRPTPSPPTDDS